ncbi:uncharacterized protein LOC141527366 [Cotesia typhae]|uniref:uncharacterized protein LOC141527366 n=1 Tax=Cotesia typhae TaxID=2053667 RepID=UPI003D6993B9
MALYCLLSNMNQSQYCIVPTIYVHQVNKEGSFEKVKLNEYLPESKCFVRGGNLKIGIGAFYIVDTADDYNDLKKMNNVTKRIIIEKLPNYSPSIGSKVNKKTAPSTTTKVTSARAGTVIHPPENQRHAVPAMSDISEKPVKEVPENNDCDEGEKHDDNSEDIERVLEDLKNDDIDPEVVDNDSDGTSVNPDMRQSLPF